MRHQRASFDKACRREIQKNAKEQQIFRPHACTFACKDQQLIKNTCSEMREVSQLESTNPAARLGQVCRKGPVR
jgi:hypothetical protein